MARTALTMADRKRAHDDERCGAALRGLAGGRRPEASVKRQVLPARALRLRIVPALLRAHRS